MKTADRLIGKYENQDIIEYQLFNDNGMSLSCINYGCIITKIMVPDKHGNFENVVLGFDNFEDYTKAPFFFGAIVGRVAGRIKDGKFSLDGQEYALPQNNYPNHLHGNERFNKSVWVAEKIEKQDAVGIRFCYDSPDGEEGYPGNLTAYATYLLNNNNELIIILEAKTDKRTIVNLANHSYFNLSGDCRRDIREHFLEVDNSGYLELDAHSIPTGNIVSAKNTPFDFKQGKFIKEGMESEYPQNMLVGHGYDHAIIFNNKGENTAELIDRTSGRKMIMTTDQPCFVFYTGNMLGGNYDIFGIPVRKYLGLCLEAQGYPDAIHHEKFPSIVLNPGERYLYTTKYGFSLDVDF